MYIPICNPNKFTLDHCETLAWSISWSVIWHLSTKDTLERCKKCHELLFIIQKGNYILHILMLLGILSSAWNKVRENKKWLYPWIKTQLTKERKLILARVTRCQNISITIARLPRAKRSWGVMSKSSKTGILQELNPPVSVLAAILSC